MLLRTRRRSRPTGAESKYRLKTKEKMLANATLREGFNRSGENVVENVKKDRSMRHHKKAAESRSGGTVTGA
jgi:hypothetical protein